MATHVLVTIDTELSAGRQARGWSARANFDSSITGRCAAGDFGLGWQLDRLEAAGLRGVCFVDPMPALVHGPQIIADIVGPIVARGHEVQLHIHTEWLEWAQESPVGAARGRNIGDFSASDQRTLLAHARDLLVAAGAPAPCAFRAGNYGANDATIAALDAIGIGWDSSANPAYLDQGCRVSIEAGAIGPVARGGVTLLPVSGIADRPGHFRPAQVCALSAAEMRAGLRHAADAGHPAFVIVSHSFEMLARDRQRPNRTVMARFEAMCRAIAGDARLRTAGFAGLDLPPAAPDARRLQSTPWRTGARIAAQALATLRYERGEGA